MFWFFRLKPVSVIVACVISKVLMAVNGHHLLNAKQNSVPVCHPNTIRPRVSYASAAGEERLSMTSVWRILKRLTMHTAMIVGVKHSPVHYEVVLNFYFIFIIN